MKGWRPQGDEFKISQKNTAGEQDPGPDPALADDVGSVFCRPVRIRYDWPNGLGQETHPYPSPVPLTEAFLSSGLRSHLLL